MSSALQVIDAIAPVLPRNPLALRRVMTELRAANLLRPSGPGGGSGTAHLVGREFCNIALALPAPMPSQAVFYVKAFEGLPLDRRNALSRVGIGPDDLGSDYFSGSDIADVFPVNVRTCGEAVTYLIEGFGGLHQMHPSLTKDENEITFVLGSFPMLWFHLSDGAVKSTINFGTIKTDYVSDPAGIESRMYSVTFALLRVMGHMLAATPAKKRATLKPPPARGKGSSLKTKKVTGPASHDDLLSPPAGRAYPCDSTTDSAPHTQSDTEEGSKQLASHFGGCESQDRHLGQSCLMMDFSPATAKDCAHAAPWSRTG